MFLDCALELLGVVALKKTSEFGLQRRERRGFIGGEGLARGGERRPYAQRRRRGDLVRKIDGAIELFARRRHLLDKTQAIRFRGTPFVAGEHVTHGVAPAGLTREADRGAAAGEDSARDFTLTKDSVVCRDADIRGEEELMPEVFGAAMQGDHDPLRAIGWPQADRVDVIRILGRELARPASVSITEDRSLRWKRAAPSEDSSCWIRALTADWATCRRPAAFRRVEDELTLANRLAAAEARQQEAVEAAVEMDQLAARRYVEGASDIWTWSPPRPPNCKRAAPMSRSAPSDWSPALIWCGRSEAAGRHRSSRRRTEEWAL